MQLKRFFSATLSLTLFCSSALAVQYHVYEGESIQAAIDSASTTGDEIIVHPGTYYEAIDFLGKAINLHSSDGADVTVIDANGLSTSVVTCATGEGSDTILEGFTITGGNGTYYWEEYWGGGMRNAGASPAVNNCIFIDNTGNGAGMLNYPGNPTVTNCSFIDNYADSGMYNVGSSPVVINCTFINNSGYEASGGMYNWASSPIVLGCTFTDNQGEIGGGMCNTNGSHPVVSNCKFTANSGGEGGGIRNLSQSNSMIINCTFTNNIAYGGGGGIENDNSSPDVINCTFSDNNNGSGIYNRNGSSPTVTNCILWDNNPDEIVDESGSVTTLNYCDIQGGWTGAGSNNINADPLFVDPYNDDYHLQPGSPCIDAGDNTTVPVDVTTDLDGNARFVDDPNTVDTGNGTPPIVDMGAYEYWIGEDCNGNNIPDDVDILTGFSQDCNGNGIPDECDVIDTIYFDSGQLIPFGGLGNEQSYTIVQPAEAEGDVTLNFAAYTDLDKTTEYVDVDLNGMNLGSFWVNDGHDCPEIPDTAEIILTAEDWNLALSVGGGDATINMNPTSGVWANQCPEDSYVIVEVLYFISSGNDVNGNGIPDECECPADLTGDDQVNINDIFAVLGLWGDCPDPCPPYCTGDLTEDCTVNIDDIFAILGQWGPCE